MDTSVVVVVLMKGAGAYVPLNILDVQLLVWWNQGAANDPPEDLPPGEAA